MRKDCLFAGIIITLAMVIISCSMAIAESTRRHDVEQPEKAFVPSPQPLSWPQNNSSDPCSSTIKSTMSRAHVQTPFCVRINRIIFCLLEISLPQTDMDQSRPQIHITLNRFFLNLFGAVVSPNAP